MADTKISALTNNTTIVDADIFPHCDDPAGTPVTKGVTATNLWTNYLKGKADALYQPLDSDLTAIAALTTTAAGRSALTFTDPNLDALLFWDDSGAAVIPTTLATVATEASPATGDYLFLIGAEGDLRKVDWSTLPGAGSVVDTANSPGAGEWAKFTDADTIEGRTAAELKADLDLEAGTDFLTPAAIAAAYQPLDADLTSIAALTTTAAGRSVLTFTDPNADRVLAWDDTAGAATAIALADLTDEASPATGDYILIYGAEGDLRKTNWSNIPSGSGTVTTANSPNANEFARFTSSTAIEGLTYAEARAALDLEAGTDFYSISAADSAISAATVGKREVFIPATSMVPQVTNGAAEGYGESATNDVMRRTLDFDATTAEYAQFFVRMPKGWNASTVTFIPTWSHPSTATNFGVVWELAGLALANDDALDTAFGTGQTSTDTGGTTDDIYIGPESSAITIGNTPSKGDFVVFRIGRLPANASDTMAVDARLHGISLYYTTDAATDA